MARWINTAMRAITRSRGATRRPYRRPKHIIQTTIRIPKGVFNMGLPSLVKLALIPDKIFRDDVILIHRNGGEHLPDGVRHRRRTSHVVDRTAKLLYIPAEHLPVNAAGLPGSFLLRVIHGSHGRNEVQIRIFVF